MSNPVVTVGDTITPPDTEVEWDDFSRITFSESKFFVYSEGEYSAAIPAGFDPSLLGDEYFIYAPLQDALGGVKPSFTAPRAWKDGLQRAPSGFVNPVTNSLLPALIIPTDILVDNGLKSSIPSGRGNLFAYYYDPPGGVVKKDVFNWEVVH
jgi:hypothetical protein